MIAVVAACTAGSFETAQPSGEIVTTSQGELLGVRQGGVLVFKGVPYAAPPVGELRWRPPAPPAAWQGVRTAHEYGAPCVQTSEMGRGDAPVIGSEDCLTLNVWVPLLQHSELPVMMWIHGGFSNWGSSSAIVRGIRLYDGQYLAEHGSVIVVTVNYRLGPLGFFAHPALSAETSYHGSGNYGYMDLIAALRWIRYNVAAFGGDPTNVTVFGESAGATAVGALLCSSQARGLFQHAVQMSGAYVKRPLHVAEGYGLQLSEALGCTGAGAASCMRSKPATALITSLPRAFASGGEYYKYDVDGYVLTEPIQKTFAAGKQTPVPLITGVTSEEAANLLQYYGTTAGSLSMHDNARDAVQSFLQNLLQVDPASAERMYTSCAKGYSSPRLAEIGCATRPIICANQRFAAIAARRARVYRYIYSHTFHAGPMAELGAGHGVELSFVFHNFPPPPKYPPPNNEELALSDALIAYLTHFGKTGDPNHANQASPWPILMPTANRLPYLQLSTKPEVRYTSDKDCQDVWKAERAAAQETNANARKHNSK